MQHANNTKKTKTRERFFFTFFTFFERLKFVLMLSHCKEIFNEEAPLLW
jgi:hypothetical protein